MPASVFAQYTVSVQALPWNTQSASRVHVAQAPGLSSHQFTTVAGEAQASQARIHIRHALTLGRGVPPRNAPLGVQGVSREVRLPLGLPFVTRAGACPRHRMRL